MSKEQSPDNDYTLAIPGKSNRTFGTLFDDKAREEEIKKGTATGEKILEKRRREFEECSIQLDAVKNELLNKGRELTPEQIKNLLVMQLVVGIPAIVSGLGIIVDSVSCQESRKLKGGKIGYARLTTSRILYEIASMLSGLYGEPDANGKIPEKEKGVLDSYGEEYLERQAVMINQLFAIGGMMHMKGKREDPRMFAGEFTDPKTGTKIAVDDLFDGKIMEQFEPEAASGVRVAKEEKVFDEGEALTAEEAEEAKTAVKVDIGKAMKGLGI
jgi:hypothetical protein